ncbi:MAG: hypothetical protein ABSE68_01195 [Minisyncoccia bacterium]
MEQKIFLQKEDDLEKAVGEIIASTAERIILNIPKNSVLGVSVHNFQVLEREGMTSGKELAIESVDDHILELASIATIPAVNPVFKVKETAVADILPRPLKKEKEEEEKPAKKTRAKSIRKPATKKLPVRKKRDIFEEIKKEEELKITEYEEKRPEREKEPKKIFENTRKPRKSLKFKLTVLIVSAAVFGLGYWVAVVILPKADIAVSIEKTTISFSYQVSVDASVDTPSASGQKIILPGQLSVAGGKPGNLSMTFPATGSSTVSTKAGGMLTVYNNYSASQTLVINTRFESPEGKIFRSVKPATILKGKSLDIQVVADKTGPDYNIGPSSGWHIPGFKNKPQYDKFSVEAKSSMTGGASGNQIVPTLDDIKNARSKIETTLSDSLKSQSLILSSDNFKLLDGASVFSVTSTINSQVDKDNNFSIFAVGELRQLVFNKTMLEDSIMQLAAGTSTASVKIDDFPITYGTSTADLAAGKMSFAVSGQVVYEPKIDFDAFKNDILGKDADTLKTMLFALPGLKKANISLWPFWASSVPTRASRVNINME